MITIAGWTDTFENADTRKRQRLGWHLTPTGCESRGYRRLMRQGVDGVLAFGVFRALCQAFATLPLETRATGAFANSDGSPMTVDDLAELVRIDAEIVENALGILAEVGWIHREPEQSAGHLPVICRSPAGSLPVVSRFC